MRVTNQVMADTVRNNLFRKTDRLLEIQNTIASGKRINRPSDDPIGMGRVMDYRKTLATVEQYDRNIEFARASLQVSDTALGSVDTLIVRAKEIAVYQATGTATAATRSIAAEEVRNIRDQIVQLANTQVAGRYIFSGYRTDTPTFAQSGGVITAQGDEGQQQVLVGDNTHMAGNVSGKAVFEGDARLFDLLGQLVDGLEGNDSEVISGQIEALDEALQQVLDARAQVGANLNRLESAQNYWSNFTYNLEELLSATEEVDIAKAYTDLTTQEAAYQATLQAAARIIQPSLMNFIN